MKVGKINAIFRGQVRMAQTGGRETKAVLQ